MGDNKDKKSNSFGMIGVVLGVIALGMALFHFWSGPISPSPAVEVTIADQACKIKKAVEAKIKGKKYKRAIARTSRFNGDRIVDMATIGTAFLAIILAVISFIRHENIRVCGSAVVLGGGAIAFQFLTVALGVIVFAIIITAVLSQMGLDIW